MFNANQFKEMRFKKHLSEDDIIELIRLQNRAYKDYTTFCNTQCSVDNKFYDFTLSKILKLSYAQYKEKSGSEEIATRCAMADQEFYDSACMLAFGRRAYYSDADVMTVFGSQDRYEDVMRSALFKTALMIPIKARIQEFKTRAKTAKSGDYEKLAYDINRLRDIYTFTSKLANDRLSNMYEENYRSIDNNGKPVHGEFDLDIVEYQMYIINQNLAKIIKLQNKIEKRHLHITKNKSLLSSLSKTTFERAEEKEDPSKEESNLENE